MPKITEKGYGKGRRAPNKGRKLAACAAAGVDHRPGKSYASHMISYWRAVSDLAQKQEHASTKESEPLTTDDARRLVFQTLVVMVEMDATLPTYAPA